MTNNFANKSKLAISCHVELGGAVPFLRDLVVCIFLAIILCIHNGYLVQLFHPIFFIFDELDCFKKGRSH